MTDEQKQEQEKNPQPKTLQDIIIEAIKSEETKLDITEEPAVLKYETFDHTIGQYFLTKENIRQVTQIICQHKEKEEWLDIYLIEYKDGKISDNYDRLSTKQGLLKEKPKKEFEGVLRLIIRDNQAVLIRSYNKEIENEANEVFKNLKKLGLKELRFNPDKSIYELV